MTSLLEGKHNTVFKVDLIILKVIENTQWRKMQRTDHRDSYGEVTFT